MTDKRSKAALDVASWYLRGRASADELKAALTAAEKSVRSAAAVSTAWATESVAHEVESTESVARAVRYAAHAARKAGASATAQSAKLRAILDAGKWVD